MSRACFSLVSNCETKTTSRSTVIQQRHDTTHSRSATPHPEVLRKVTAGYISTHHAMNGTPTLRSSFPSTPLSGNRAVGGGAAPGTNFGSPRLPDVRNLAPPSLTRQDPDGPLISFDTIDAPAQRAYVVGLYTALWFWRLYDYYLLTVGESESLWLFMKWAAIDIVFLFSLPGFRIPWLEWSVTTTVVLFLLHMIVDIILMFRLQVSCECTRAIKCHKLTKST